MGGCSIRVCNDCSLETILNPTTTFNSLVFQDTLAHNMRLALLLPLLPILAVSAAPTSIQGATDIDLQEDDAIVLLNDGGMLLMKQHEVDQFAASLAIDPLFDGVIPENPFLNSTDLMDMDNSDDSGNSGNSDNSDNSDDSDNSDGLNSSNGTLAKRGGWGNVELVVPGKKLTFLDWDVAMSPVVDAHAGEVSIAITDGKMIADSITGGGGATLNLIPDFLSLNGNVNKGKTTTSSVSGTLTFKVPKGYVGAVVSRPLTHREYGWVWRGRPGFGHAEYWQSDTHEDSTFHIGRGTLKWVKGVITVCLGHKYPLPRCHGKGSMW